MHLRKWQIEIIKYHFISATYESVRVITNRAPVCRQFTTTFPSESNKSFQDKTLKMRFIAKLLITPDGNINTCVD